MQNQSRARRPRALTAAVATLALSGLVATALPATAATVENPETIQIVDPDASAQTRSLFSYLRDVRGKGILFGQQHTTSYGVTVSAPDGTSSDVNNGVGDFPAVFGWDTLIIEGFEQPGSRTATTEANIAALADYMEKADAIGGINTLSAHMSNFVTGGNFNDTDGDVVASILPGGPQHAELAAYLDNVAALADSTRDADGNLIPIIFRPWHENAGSWFWWGAAHATPGQYKELWRYTVEYLRDTKGVTNFLYAYSPGGGFGGVDDVYLRTYPGDAYVDILGYDNYDNATTEDSSTWLSGVVADLGMLADLAESKGKVSAFTEFGVNTRGLKPNGENPNLHWYTDVLNAIKADPKASQSAYMPTWANFGVEQFFVPYPAQGDLAEHELLPDLKAFEADEFSLFAGDLDHADIYGRDVATVEHDASMHIVSPASGARITASPSTVRVRVVGDDATAASFTVGDSTTEHALTLDSEGYWSAEWTIADEDLNNSTQALHVSVELSDGTLLTEDTSVILGSRPVLAPGVVDDYEGYGDDTAMRSEYSPVGVNTLTLETTDVGVGSKAMRFGYDFASQTYTGAVKKFSADWSTFTDLSLWLQPDGSGNKMVLQIIADGVAFEAYPSLAGTTASTISLPFADWRPAPWDTGHADRRLDSDSLQKITQFNIYVNEEPTAGVKSGSFVVDEIRATGVVASGFTDVVVGDPYFREIKWAGDNGIALPFKDGTFRPASKVTREAMAGMLYRYVSPDFTPAAGVQTFADVKAKHPLFTEIEWLASQGLDFSPVAPAPKPSKGPSKGKDSTKPVVTVKRFNPAGPATRETMAQVLYTLAGQPATTGTTSFRDVPSTSPAATAIAWLSEVGIATGDVLGNFRPKQVMTRADMAVFLYRYDALPEPPAESVSLYTFDDGVQGWSAASWGPGGSVSAQDGALGITSPADGNWFGLDSGLGDLTGRTEIVLDLVETTGTDPKVSLKLGSGWTWCETGNAGWADTPRVGDNAVVFDLTTLSAECSAMLNDVKGLNIYFNEGTHVIDNVAVR